MSIVRFLQINVEGSGDSGSGTELPELERWLCHLLVVRPRASYLASDFLFPPPKTGIKLPLTGEVSWRLNTLIPVEYLEQHLTCVPNKY